MKAKKSRKSSFKAGMYLLENLTSGMYNDPLSIYREYIQNAVDSIDLITQKQKRDSLEVTIELDPFERSITIRDNGEGIPASVAEGILSSIGSSNKTGNNLRGFRGIGRLGGLAFSDRAVFRTKAEGENIESVQEWDCKNLATLLTSESKRSLSLRQVFDRITTFSQENCRKSTGSYFEVTLQGVSSFRNHIFDLERVRRYLNQVAPLPFNPDEFSYGPRIDHYLEKNLSHYGRYNIILNGEPVYKPYSDSFRTTNKGFDHIDDVILFEIKDNNENPIAYGWYGQRRSFLGALARGNDFSGIHVRVGNILIGDARLLDSCFREARFNAYVIGEIHADSDDLTPNSRRDDFIDNRIKGLFYNSVERQIGLPLSKEIRSRSRQKSELAKKFSQDGGTEKSQESLEEFSNKDILASEDKSVMQFGGSGEENSDSHGGPNFAHRNTLAEIFTQCCKGCDRLPKLLTCITQHYSSS